MQLRVPVSFAVDSVDDLVPCFDATAAEVFVTACHLVDGRRSDAEALLIDVFLVARNAAEAGATVVVDHEWIVATALRQVLGQDQNGAEGTLTARERAVIELHLVDGSDIEAVAATLGLTTDEVASSLARFDDAEAFSTSLVGDLLRRSELWLDDATRRRARAALRAGRRIGAVAPVPSAASRALGSDRRRSTVAAHASRAADAAVPADPPADPRPDEALRRPHRSLIVAAAAMIVALTALVVALVPTDGVDRDAAPVAAEVVPVPEPSGKPAAATSVVPNLAVDDPPLQPPDVDGRTGPDLRVQPADDPAGGTPLAAPGAVLGSTPSGFVANGSDEVVDPPAAGRFQVWAEPEATRSNGRWLALVTLRTAGSATTIVPDGLRESIDDAAAVMSFDQDGIPVLRVQPSGGGQFSITGGGFSRDELRQLAAGITLDGDVATFDPTLTGLRDGLLELVDTSSESGDLAPHVLAGVRRTATYVSADGDFIRLTTQATTPDDLRIGELVLAPSSDSLATSPNRTVQMGPLALSISSAPEGDAGGGRSSVRWHAGDETLTLSGSTGLYRLLGAVPDVRPASQQEWADLFGMDRVQLGTGTIGCDADTQVGRTTTADGSRWTVSMCAEPLAMQIAVGDAAVADVMADELIALDPLRPVIEYVSMTSTTVLVVVSDDRATGVAIAIAGTPTTTLPLVPLAGTGVSAAAMTFGEISPYTVALVDEVGDVVRVLTP